MNDILKVAHLISRVIIEKCTTLIKSSILEKAGYDPTISGLGKGDDHGERERGDPSGTLHRGQEYPCSPSIGNPRFDPQTYTERLARGHRFASHRESKI
jgi:hypothetical protein